MGKLQPMILAQFAFLKGTLQSELPSRVSCSFSLSSSPFCAFCRNAEGAKICLLQGRPYTVVPTPILHILLIAAKIATQKKNRNKNHRFYRQYFLFLFCKERKKKKSTYYYCELKNESKKSLDEEKYLKRYYLC